MSASVEVMTKSSPLRLDSKLAYKPGLSLWTHVQLVKHPAHLRCSLRSVGRQKAACISSAFPVQLSSDGHQLEPALSTFTTSANKPVVSHTDQPKIQECVT